MSDEKTPEAIMRLLDDIKDKSNRIEALEAENERLRLSMMGGEDAPGYAASVPLDDLIRSFEQDRRAQSAYSEQLFAENERLRAANDAAMREATSLAVALHRRWYYEVTQWRPITDSVAGVISQIDNMSAGIGRRLDVALAELAQAPAALPHP